MNGKKILGFGDLPVGIGFVSIPVPGGGIVSTLTIGGQLEHNRTTVQCVAELTGASTVTPGVTFLIQGQLYCSYRVIWLSSNLMGWPCDCHTMYMHMVETCVNLNFAVERHTTKSLYNFMPIFPAVILSFLDAAGPLQSVSNITRNVNMIAWEAPFSLNLTNVDPDIVYCVEVYNITCGRSLLISECDVMETSYTNDALYSGYIYEYTVTPRSNVEGARNGTNLTEIGMLIII